MRLVTAVLIGLLTLLASCFEPRKWPIPELQPPGSAAPARIPAAMIDPEIQPFMSEDGSRIKEGPQVYGWMRGFNYGLGWDSLVRHVESALNPLGYKPYTGNLMQQIPDIPGVPDGTVGRAWIAPDGKYLVAMMNVAFIKSRADGQINQTDADYVLAIDQVKDLPPQLQEKVKSY